MPPPISAFVMKIPPANSRLPSGGLFDDDEEEDFEHASGPGDGRSRAFSSSEEGRKLGKQGASTGTSNSSSYNGGRSLFTAEERGGGSSAEGEADSVSGGSNATVNDGYKGKIEAALEKGFLKLGGGSVITKTVAEKNCIEGLFDVGQQGKLISSQNEPAKMDGWKEPSVKAVGRAGSLGLFDDDDELEDEFHVGPGERAASRGSSNGTSNRAVPKEEPISLSGLFGIPSKRSSENAVQGILKLESATFPRKGGLFDESEDDEEGSTAAIEETVSEADKYLSGIGSGAVEGRQVLAGAVRVLEEASSAPSVNASTRSKLLASAVAALRRPRSDESEDEFEVSQSDEEEENKVPQSTERRIFEPKPADEGWVIGSDQETRVAEFDSGRAVEGRRVERMEKDGAEGAEREGDRKVAVRNDMNQMNFAVGLEAALKRRAGGGGLFGGDNDEASGDEESPRERFLGMKEGEESRSSVNGQGAGNSPVDPVREILGERNIFSAASSINRASNVDMNSEVISRADGNGISHIGGLPQGLVVAPEKRLLGDGARAEDHGGSTSFSWKPVIGKREVEKLGGEKKTFDSLFGNDDDEEEDALFGPLNGKGSKFTSSDLFSRG